MKNTAKQTKILWKKWLLPAAIAAVCLLGAVLFFLPSFRNADLNAYYGIAEGGTFVIENESLLRGADVQKENDRYYFPLTIVSENWNCRFYEDADTDQVWYVLPDGIMKLTPDASEYEYQGTKSLDYAPLIRRNGALYLELDWICRYTRMEYAQFSDLDRLWIWTDYENSVSYAQTEKKTVLRTRASRKGDVIRTLEATETVVVISEEKFWDQVLTTDGQVGYVKASALGTLSAVTRSGDWFAEQEYPSMQMEDPIVMGWHYVDDLAIGLESLEKRITECDGLNVISPTWFTVSDEEGGFRSFADPSYVEKAHAAGMQVWAMVDNINLKTDELKLLSSSEAREKLERGLVDAAVEAGIEGLNLDFESLNAEIAPHYLEFERELSLLCDEAGLYLSADNSVPRSYRTYYNLEEQSKILDYVVIMGYDGSWEEPGPNASLPFVQEGLESSLELIPAEKLIQGIPFYSRMWYWSGEKDDWDRTPFDMRRSAELEADCKDLAWSEEDGCYFGTITVDEIERQVWFEDLDSAKARLDLIGSYHVAGISAWSLGSEDPEVWSIIRDWSAAQVSGRER